MFLYESTIDTSRYIWMIFCKIFKLLIIFNNIINYIIIISNNVVIISFGKDILQYIQQNL